MIRHAKGGNPPISKLPDRRDFVRIPESQIPDEVTRETIIDEVFSRQGLEWIELPELAIESASTPEILKRVLVPKQVRPEDELEVDLRKWKKSKLFFILENFGSDHVQLGLATAENLEANQILGFYAGIVKTGENPEPRFDLIWDQASPGTNSADIMINASTKGNLMRFLNHSPHANLKFEYPSVSLTDLETEFKGGKQFCASIRGHRNVADFNSLRLILPAIVAVGNIPKGTPLHVDYEEDYLWSEILGEGQRPAVPKLNSIITSIQQIPEDRPLQR